MIEQVVPTVLGYLERQIVDGLLMTDGLTIADITIASNLLNYRYLGFRIDPGRHPRLAGGARAISHPAVPTALDAEIPYAEQMDLDRSFR